MYAVIDASSNNIPVSYDTTAGSRIINGAPTGGHITLYNSTSDFIGVTVQAAGTTAVPSSSISSNTSQYLIWPAPSGGAATTTADFFKIAKGDRVYIKTLNASPMASGKVAVTFW